MPMAAGKQLAAIVARNDSNVSAGAGPLMPGNPKSKRWGVEPQSCHPVTPVQVSKVWAH